MRNKPSPADIDLAINQAKHGGWIDPTDEPDGWECLLRSQPVEPCAPSA